ncbi:MAG: hypothetical protein HN350_20265 [Phycisphaerales bacterium]|nr:hypothetical protein [Phycisphaerales bacterium]
MRNEAKVHYVAAALILFFIGVCPSLLIWFVLFCITGFEGPEFARLFPVVVVLMAIGGHTSVSCLRGDKPGRLAAIEDLREGKVDEIEVQASAVSKMKPAGDNDLALCFQVGVDRLLFMQGYYLYDARIYDNLNEANRGDRAGGEIAFPNDHFIIRRLPRNGKVLSIKLLGRALQSGKDAKGMKRKYRFPESTLIEGSLDSLSTSLVNAHKALQQTRKDHAAELRR